MKREELRIPAAGVVLTAHLTIPGDTSALAVFVSGAGSTSLNPRNVFVANEMAEAGLATLLLDLLTPEEEAVDYRTAEYRFDVAILARRLIAATHWMHASPVTGWLPIAYHAANTGAAAALIAAAELQSVFAIACRGGRPDLAKEMLATVRAATLLIVGSEDHGALHANREAFAHLECEKRIEIIDGASHGFDEPGTLQRATTLASTWIAMHVPVLV